MSKDRVSRIDTDIEFSRRPEVMAYITQKYGAENVCHIITFGTLAAKQAVQDVARTLGYPASFGISISSMIPKTVGITIAKALEESNDLQTAYKTNPEIKKVVDIAMKLEGNKRHASQHACFTGETLVTTSDGIKQIAEVKRGDMVITHTGCYKPVVNTIITENNETYDVAVYKGQSFTATGNHPILVKRLIYGDPEWITVDKLTEGDYLCIPIIKSETVPIIQGLPTIRHSFWWIVGRYIGDGWTEEYPCFQNGKPGVKRRVIICGGKDQAKGTDSEITAKLEECGFSYCVEFHRSEDIIYINDADPLYFYLQSFGGRYDRKTLTNDILDLPVEYAKVFLNGYMSAVGSYSQSTREYSCKLTSRELAAGISRIINKVYKIGVDFSTIPVKKEFIKGCRVNTKKTYALYFKPAEQNDFMSFYDSGCIWVAFRKKQKNNKTVPTYNLTVLDDSSYTANGVAVHNCGLVCSPSAVSDFLPTSMELDKETGLRGLTSQVTKDEVEEMSLIKMDLLGLKTLGVIHEIIDRVKETRGLNEVLTQIHSKRSTLRYQDIPLDDRKVYQMLAKGHTGAVFQLESEGMTKLICQMFSDVDALPEERLGECFERLVAAVALYRPGPMDYIPNYIAGLQDHKNIKYLTPELKEILEPTYGVIVYQEQVMQIVQKLAGYTLGRADVVRKAMGKKKQDLLASEEHVFINGNRNEFDSGKDKNYAPGCIANGIPIGVAKEIWSQMSDFAKYAFNRSHAVCYAFLSYITAYMRCYWPEEFYAAMLNAFIENSDKTHIYLYQAAHCGINILPPDINRSQCNFMAEKGSIRFGLSGINGIKSAATDVVKERDERGPYSDVQDLYERLADKGAGLTKKSIEGLVYSGALSEFSSNKMALLRQYELIEAAYKKTAADRELGQISLFSQDELKIGLPEVPPFSEMRSMQLEYSVLGYYLSKHPTEAILKKISPPKTYVALDELASVTNMDRKVTILTIGMINHLKMFYTKSGSMMYTFSLETKFSSVSAVVFPDVLEKFGELLTEASVVAIWADFVYDDRREGMQLVVNKVLDPLAYVETAKTPVVISVINKAEQDEVLAYVEAHGGDTPVELEYNGKRYPLKRGVQYNASAIAYFQNILDKRIS